MVAICCQLDSGIDSTIYKCNLMPFGAFDGDEMGWDGML